MINREKNFKTINTISITKISTKSRQ